MHSQRALAASKPSRTNGRGLHLVDEGYSNNITLS
jgi:hypothetical protein